MPEVEDGDIQEAVAIRNRIIGDNCKAKYDALLAYTEGLIAVFGEYNEEDR